MVNSAPEGSFRQDTGSLDSLYRHFTGLKLQLKAENTPLFLAATCRHPALSHQIGCYSTLRPLARQLCICPRTASIESFLPLTHSVGEVSWHRPHAATGFTMKHPWMQREILFRPRALAPFVWAL